MATAHDPLYDGQAILGAASDFSVAVLARTPAGRDTFLGYAPGTSTEPPGPMFACSGTLRGRTSAAVQAAIDTLSGYAGLSAPFGYPTGLMFPDDFRWAPHSCRFLASDFVPGSITPVSANAYKSDFKIVIRQVA